MTANPQIDPLSRATADRLNLRRWFATLWVYFALLIGLTAWLLHRDQLGLRELMNPGFYTGNAHQAVKLLVYAIYMSISCTFVPLPTAWIISALALQDVALSNSFWITTVLVATVGAAASTVANLNDYHLMSWMLRSHRVAKVRQARFYAKAAAWFSRSPFQLLLVFNLLPIPIDVARMLAAAGRYPLRPFILANFIGRWIRYAVIAAVTFELGERGWIATLLLLAITVAFGIRKAAQWALAKLRSRGATEQEPQP